MQCGLDFESNNSATTAVMVTENTTRGQTSVAVPALATAAAMAGGPSVSL